jgi:glucose/arabinose dehydrogenase
MPVIVDDEFVVEEFVQGIPESPSTMAFVGQDILVLQKSNGQVRLIRDGALQGLPALDVNVDNKGEQGMLGIATVDERVYLYFSESETDGGNAIAKRVYRYTWDHNRLIDPELVRDLNATQQYHNGGAMASTAEGAVYLVLGDAGRYGALQNNGVENFADTSVIMRVDSEEPYYAIGIRNSFGLAIDPVNSKMWDTENGDDMYDEINLVDRGFNSGWIAIMGPTTDEQLSMVPVYENYEYSNPEFSWETPVVPTALSFVDSDQLAKFRNSLFVGTCSTGTLYRFTLNEARDGFVFETAGLGDNVANIGDSLDEIVFGKNFGCITDAEIGPDGLLYITSLSEGTIFRVVPRHLATGQVQGFDGLPLAALAGLAIAGGIAVYVTHHRKRKRNSPPKERENG